MSTEKIALILAVWGVIQTIVRLTPTKKDDEICSKIGKIINLVFNKTNTK